MLDCFLLLLQRGAKWIPLFVVPVVIAGGVASICLIVSGIKGVIAESLHPKRRVGRAARPEHIVHWISLRRHHQQSG
jgi:hypothetical protein